MAEANREFEHKPATVREFIVRPEYLGLEDEAYPAIIDVLEELFAGDYNEAALCWGIGAGKTYAASLAILYLLHRTLCLKNPQRYYGLGAGSMISFLNMGPSGEQARRVMFNEMLRKVSASPWFSDHYPPKVLSRELRFPKNIAVLCGNSAETYPLGYNILGAVIDEASWLLESKSGQRDSAEEIYNALQRRIRSRFLNHGLLVMISSPRHRGDFLERKMAEAATNPAVYASRKAQWELKPKEMYCGKTFQCGGLEIPIEYEAEFKRNEQRALRDLAAVPAEAFTPFFPDRQVLEAAIVPEMRHPCDEQGRLAEWWGPKGNARHYLHVDLGLKRDACGIAMAHCEAGEEGDGEPIVVVDLMLQLLPPEDGELELAGIRALIVEIAARGFNLAQVSFDGYQSADSRQILTRKGLTVKLVSVDRDAEAYETFKGLLNEGRLRWYRYQPVLEECLGLEVVQGNKVDHRPGGTKDVSDAVAAVVKQAVDRWQRGDIRAHIV